MSKKKTIKNILLNINSDVPNKNGVVYPKEVMKNALEEYQKQIKLGTSFGIMGQPTTIGTINLSEVAFKINSIEETGNDNWISQIEILDTPKGKDLKKLLNDVDDDKYRIVTYGYGSVKEKDGINIVQDDFELISVGIKLKEECA